MIDGVRIGSWTDPVGRTGCTVVLLPEATVASGEVRGGAPGTREFDLLAPGRLVEHVDAVVLTGGSAFGLAACEGVVRWCEQRGRGFPTRAGPVPIVVGMVLYDLGVGTASARPDAAAGYEACQVAEEGLPATGAVGAGTGATVAKWQGPEHARPGGMGAAIEVDGDLRVAALVAVNAVGDLRTVGLVSPPAAGALSPDAPFENTTIGVVLTNATIDKLGCHLVSQSAHDGLARALEPAHTRGDGDAFVACATGVVDAQLERVRLLAARAVERAIRTALAG